MCIHKSISISCAIQQMVSVHFFSHAFVLVSIFLALAIQLACTQHRTTSSLHPYRSCVKHTKRHGLGTDFCTGCRTCSTLYMSDLAARDSMKSMLCMERFKPLCILMYIVYGSTASLIIFRCIYSVFLMVLATFARTLRPLRAPLRASSVWLSQCGSLQALSQLATVDGCAILQQLKTVVYLITLW